MIIATDRAVINTENYQFYINKLLTLNNIKIQNGVLTKEKIVGNWTKHIGGITGGLGSLFMIHNCIKPDTTVRTALNVAALASHMINTTDALLNYAYGEDWSPPSYQEYEQDRASIPCFNTSQLEEYIDEETEALNEKGRDHLKDLYKNTQKFRDEVINFVEDKTGLGNEKILDKRYKYNARNKLGTEVLGMFAFSKDHA